VDGIHDLGGMHGFGPAVLPGWEDAYHERWEPRVFAISMLVGIDGLGTGNGRAVREEMPPEEYLRASYYERWLWSTEQRLLRKGAIAEDEVEGWLERLRLGEEAPQRSDASQVERVQGVDTFPDIGPYRGPDEPVYSVVFESAELFGPSAEGTWTVRLDLYESYLEAT
jgi:Nitrile hydratase beta subunit, N-terminal/Nitrile hydratase beta subunit, C-terminal